MRNSIRLRHFAKVDYKDPRDYLIRLRILERAIDLSRLPDRVRRLRTNQLKSVRELRDAAIFCVGMSEVLEREIYLGKIEEQDFDFIAMYISDETQHFIPVQLKELVSDHLNPKANLDSIISHLGKYAKLDDVCVVIKLNRLGHFDPSLVSIPPHLQVGGLWMFCATNEEQTEFALWGDFMETGRETKGIKFPYPTPNNSS